MSIASVEARRCKRCAAVKPITDFYLTGSSPNRRRHVCISCMREVKREQRDPNWRPTCAQCGARCEARGSGRKALCEKCFAGKYDVEHPRRSNGAHHRKLSPCRNCGAERTRQNHIERSGLCADCRSVPQHRRKKLMAFYNMTPCDEEKLLEKQHGVCAICGEAPDDRRLCIDHDHSGEYLVRGALCRGCNSMLGFAQDDAERLWRAIEYLDRPPAQDVIPGRAANPEAHNDRGGWA